MADRPSSRESDADATPEAAPSATVFLRNDEGTPVDAVPFLVTLTMAFLVVFSFGPMYGQALGWSADGSLAACGVVFAGLAVAAYVRLVAKARPSIRKEVPAERRLVRLLYAMAGMAVVLAALVLPLL